MYPDLSRPRPRSALAALVAVIVLALFSTLLSTAPARAAGSAISLRVGDATPTGPSLSLSSTEVAQGETLRASYATPDAAAKNWIGLYREADGMPDGDPGSRDWDYAPDAQGTLEFVIDPGVFAPGRYRAFFLANDGYERLGESAAFTVLPAASSLTPLVEEHRAVDARVGEVWTHALSAYFATTGVEAPVYSLADAPGWMSVDGDRVTGTPDEPGTHTVRVRASLAGYSAEVSVHVRVMAADATIGDALRVMTYNAWHRGTQVAGGREKELAAFLGQGADVVALQETSPEHAAELAERLGWEVAAPGGDTAVISRYPLDVSRTSAAAMGVRVVVDAANDRAAWVWSAHLGYTRYGPYYARDGESVQHILSEENVERGPQARKNIADMATVQHDYPGEPIVYAGDLNTPSHLDWTEAAKDLHYGLVVPWPVSTALQGAGFVDTFRAIHPDPVAEPANSWSPRFADEVQDRIDVIYAAGDALTAVDSRYVDGAGMDRWASDHGAFVSDFLWAPPAGHNGLALDRDELSEGESLTIDYTAAVPSPTNWVGIYRASDTPGVQDALQWRYVADAAGRLVWSGNDTEGWVGPGVRGAGEYLTYLFADGGYTALTDPVSFTMLPPAVPAPLPQTGESVDLRVLTWNIYHGGLDDDNDDQRNRAQQAEYIAAQRPDVFLAVETYGAAETILEALNANDEGRVYRGSRITSRADDNLWIFTHLPLVEEYTGPSGLSVTDFNIGAQRVRLPNNREVNLVDMWSTYTDPWIGDMIEANAHDLREGREPRYDAETVEAGDSVQEQSVTDFLEYIEERDAGQGALTIAGGDLNAVAASDWAPSVADCPSHEGLGYALRATDLFGEAGFVDAFRAAHPDVCAEPGVTWSPRLDQSTPHRIDFTFVRGDGVEIASSEILTERMPVHGDGRFYSDHAAVLTDLVVHSTGAGDDGGAGDGEPGEDHGGADDGGNGAGQQPVAGPAGALARTGDDAPWVLLAPAVLLIAGGVLLATRLARRRAGES